MDRALERMGAALASAWEALRGAVVALGPNPLAWGPVVWGPVIVLLALALLALLLPRRARSPAARGRGRPDVMLPQGALELPPSSRLARLALTVGNLGSSPVQLLEAAVREPGGTEAVVPLDALLPPHASIRVSEEIEVEPATDDVEVELFLYVPGARNSAWTLRTRAAYEPWADRWRIDPLRQRLAPARRLASAREARARREAWEEARASMADVPPVVRPEERTAPPGPVWVAGGPEERRDEPGEARPAEGEGERARAGGEERDGARAAAVEAWSSAGRNGRRGDRRDPDARPAAEPRSRALSDAGARSRPDPRPRRGARPDAAGRNAGREDEREDEREDGREGGADARERRDGRGLEFPTEF